MRNFFRNFLNKLRSDQYAALYTWIIFLSLIVILVNIMSDYNMGYRQFKIEMAEHWVDPSVPPGTLPPGADLTGGSPAALLERTYNKVAQSLDDISVEITGLRTINLKQEQVHGSGIIISDQCVLTNYHVIQDALDMHVTVFLKTPKVYHATVFLTDRTNDLALLKVDTNDVLPSAEIGNSDTVNTGDLVFAMGNAFGKGNIFTTGVVCGKNQSFFVGGSEYRNMIRTETYTYPGSSGGPLANINGQIIGVNTAIYDPQGKFTGISFAMPINRAAALIGKADPAGQNNPFSLAA